MEAPKDLFEGVRASDLRFDNLHILAEYITRAQRVVDSATRIEASAERLVEGGIKTTEEGVRQFQAALRQMQSAFNTLQGQVSLVVNATGNKIACAVADAHIAGASYILQMGEFAKLSYQGLISRTDEVTMAAERLEQAADKAEASRRLAHDEHEQLRAFKLEVERYEQESLTRLSDAKASLYEGVGLWLRLCYVLFPPVPVVRETKRPIRSSIPSRGARTPILTATARVTDRNVYPAGRAALGDHGHSK